MITSEDRLVYAMLKAKKLGLSPYKDMTWTQMMEQSNSIVSSGKSARLPREGYVYLMPLDGVDQNYIIMGADKKRSI